MRKNPELVSSADSRRTLENWINDGSDGTDESQVWNNQDANVDREPLIHIAYIDRKISTARTAGHMAIWGLAIIPVVAAGIGIAEFNLNSPPVKPPLSLKANIKSGTAEVQNLIFVPPPMTFVTSDMKTVATGDLTPVLSLGGNDIVTPSMLTVKRQNMLTLQFDVTLDMVTLDFTPDTHNPNGGALTYSVPNTAVTVEEIISTDDRNSQIDLPVVTNYYQDGAKIIQNVNGSALHLIADTKNLAPGKKITAEDIPIVGQLANGSITPQVAMDKFLDIATKSAVANNCVSKIASLDVFPTEFSKEIVNYGKMNLFNQSSESQNLKNHLSDLMSLPKKQQYAIINSATVVLMPDFANEIKPNPALQTSIDNYTHLKLFSTKGVEFKCDTTHIKVLPAVTAGSK